MAGVKDSHEEGGEDEDGEGEKGERSVRREANGEEEVEETDATSRIGWKWKTSHHIKHPILSHPIPSTSHHIHMT